MDTPGAVAVCALGREFCSPRGSESSRRARACDCPSALASEQSRSAEQLLHWRYWRKRGASGSLITLFSLSLSLSPLSLSLSRFLHTRELSDEERRLVKACGGEPRRACELSSAAAALLVACVSARLESGAPSRVQFEMALASGLQLLSDFPFARMHLCKRCC